MIYFFAFEVRDPRVHHFHIKYNSLYFLSSQALHIYITIYCNNYNMDDTRVNCFYLRFTLR